MKKIKINKDVFNNIKKNIDKTKNDKSAKNKGLIIFLSILIGLFILAIIFTIYIIVKAPTFNTNNLYQKESTLIYDPDGDTIASLGSEKRELVTYDELPEVLIDAIVATEDSRFYQHNGFDIARFTKASFGQLLGKSNAGGASTLTMQVVKNNFTSTTSSGFAGITRKFTDIYMSVFKVEKNYTKQEIIEFYVNAPYLGSGSYGVEQASKTYFGKDVKDLSLAEASIIAGLFQAPEAYNPYDYPEKTTARRNQVLNLMVKHGYITESEANVAKAISVTSLLKKQTKKTSNVSEYQGFIDTVVQQVIDDTGNNPYDTPMEIYSTMDKDKQDAINDLYDGKTYTFVDKKIQLGITAINSKTGAVVAVGAGRNKTKELSFNYATMTNKHPGSTAKPIVDYGPGIECNNWSTYTPFFDVPTTYSNGQSLHDWDNSYEGFLTLKTALAESRNTCALQAFRLTSNSCKLNFMKSLGISPELDDNDDTISESHSIGAFTGTSPTKLAAAYAAFSNGGYYTKPYSYTKVVYRQDGKEQKKSHKRKKVMSAATAYLITDVLKSSTTHNSVSSTQVATKTGTSSYDNDVLKKYGISTSAIQSSWVAFYSPSISVTFWYGYPKLSKDYYLTMNSGSYQRGLIQSVLTKGLVASNEKFTKPSTVVSAKVELGTLPAKKPSAFTPSSLIGTFLFIKGSQPTTVSTKFSKLSDVKNLKASKSGNSVTVTWSSVTVPTLVSKSDISSYFEGGSSLATTTYYNSLVKYNSSKIGKFGYDVYYKINGSLKKVGFTTKTSYTLTVPYNATAIVVKTAYSKVKTNASDGSSVTISSGIGTIGMTLNDSVSFEAGDYYSDPTNPLTITSDGETISSSNYTISYTLYKDGEIYDKTKPLISGTYTVIYSVTLSGKTYSSGDYDSNRTFTVE